MSNLTIGDLSLVGADLFADAESFMQDLNSSEIAGIAGGSMMVSSPAPQPTPPIVSSPAPQPTPPIVSSALPPQAPVAPAAPVAPVAPAAPIVSSALPPQVPFSGGYVHGRGRRSKSYWFY